MYRQYMGPKLWLFVNKRRGGEEEEAILMICPGAMQIFSWFLL